MIVAIKITNNLNLKTVLLTDSIETFNATARRIAFEYEVNAPSDTIQAIRYIDNHIDFGFQIVLPNDYWVMTQLNLPNYSSRDDVARLNDLEVIDEADGLSCEQNEELQRLHVELYIEALEARIAKQK